MPLSGLDPPYTPLYTDAMTDTDKSTQPERRTVVAVGYLCIQGYPKRICGGCTSGCCEPVYVEVDEA